MILVQKQKNLVVRQGLDLGKVVRSEDAEGILNILFEHPLGILANEIKVLGAKPLQIGHRVVMALQLARLGSVGFQHLQCLLVLPATAIQRDELCEAIGLLHEGGGKDTIKETGVMI